MQLKASLKCVLVMISFLRLVYCLSDEPTYSWLKYLATLTVLLFCTRLKQKQERERMRHSIAIFSDDVMYIEPLSFCFHLKPWNLVEMEFFFPLVSELSVGSRNIWIFTDIFVYIIAWSAVVLGNNSTSNAGSNFHEAKPSEISCITSAINP